MMIDIQEIVRGVSIRTFLFYVIKLIQKTRFMALSLPSPPPLQPNSTFTIDRGEYFASGKKVTVKLEKQISEVKGIEQNDLSLLYEKNVFQENISLKTDSSQVLRLGKVTGSKLAWKRPTCLIIPDLCPSIEFCDEDKRLASEEFEVKGTGYFLANKKGKKEVMEDTFGISLNILGDPKQAFFAVIDGHGGRAAADYVAKHLKKNILKEISLLGNNVEETRIKTAINAGYMATDNEFLSQRLKGGACVASVLLSLGHVYVANVGDCRVVLCRNGVAHTLTKDHRLSREDERHRILNTGGFVHYHKGVWRVNGSLAISRAIGDMHLKKWIISEPDILKCLVASDCEFLILASDGLWDTVSNQEAVDIVVKGGNAQESCKKLIQIAISRGSKDDITVMIIDLQHFGVEN